MGWPTRINLYVAALVFALLAQTGANWLRVGAIAMVVLVTGGDLWCSRANR